jgi:hypothetical protein
MSDVVVDHNTSGGKGGGIDSGRGDNVRITRTLISDNVAIGALGGGIFSTNHDIEITDSAIVNNGGNGQTLVGGGMDVLLYADATNTISVKNTTISGNHSTDWGAGMAIANYENNAQSILTVAKQYDCVQQHFVESPAIRCRPVRRSRRNASAKRHHRPQQPAGFRCEHRDPARDERIEQPHHDFYGRTVGNAERGPAPGSARATRRRASRARAVPQQHRGRQRATTRQD